jgi:hypothetical protein
LLLGEKVSASRRYQLIPSRGDVFAQQVAQETAENCQFLFKFR